MFRSEEIKIRLADRFLEALQLELFCHGLADAHETALLVLEVNPVRQVVQQRVQQVPLLRQSFLGAFAFDGVTHGTRNNPCVHRVPFHEIVLRSLVHRVHRERLVVLSAEHNDRRLRRCRRHALERFQSRAIRQCKVQQHEIDSAARQPFNSLFQRYRKHQFEIRKRRLRQILLQQTRIPGVILDQQNSVFRASIHER